MARRRLVLDFDPERPAGISATDEEKVLASQVAWKVQADLHSLGWPEPLTADSGNGYHLNYAVDLPADDEGLTERFLKALSAKYTTPKVKVDAALFHPSRIIKLYGTWSRKGDSIPARPHRLATVISAPKVLEVVNRALLEEFIRENAPPEPEPKAKPTKAKASERPQAKRERVTHEDIPDVALSIGDDFEARADMMEILQEHGWQIDRQLSNGDLRLTRPGKSGGTSATIRDGKGFHVFSDSSEVAPFEAGGNYGKFQAYTLLNHDGRYEDSMPAGPTWLREVRGQRRGGEAEPTAARVETQA